MDPAMEHDKLVAIQKQGEKVEVKKRIRQDRKEDLAQASKIYEEETKTLLDLIKPDDLPLLDNTTHKKPKTAKKKSKKATRSKK